MVLRSGGDVRDRSPGCEVENLAEILQEIPQEIFPKTTSITP